MCVCAPLLLHIFTLATLVLVASRAQNTHTFSCHTHILLSHHGVVSAFKSLAKSGDAFVFKFFVVGLPKFWDASPVCTVPFLAE